MKRTLTIFAILGGAAFIFSFRTAGAYAITVAPPANHNGFDNLFLPFQNFFHSINSVGSIPMRVELPSVVPPAVGAGARSAFQRFDDWLYGIAGFHISNFFDAILHILSWLLGFVKSTVDWLIGLFRNQG